MKKPAELKEQRRKAENFYNDYVNHNWKTDQLKDQQEGVMPTNPTHSKDKLHNSKSLSTLDNECTDASTYTRTKRRTENKKAPSPFRIITPNKTPTYSKNIRTSQGPPRSTKSLLPSTSRVNDPSATIATTR